MKILASINLSESRVGDCNGNNTLESSQWLVWPDSCWLQSDRPLYIPDFEKRFFLLPAVSFKSGRLGKCIAPKFAIRYFSAYAPTFIILSESALEEIRENRCPPASTLCHDNAVVIGKTFPLPECMEKLSLQQACSKIEEELPDYFNIEVSDAGGIISRDKAFPAPLPAIEVLACASQRNTIKTGDFILSTLKGFEPVELHQGLTVKIFSAEDDKVLLRTAFK